MNNSITRPSFMICTYIVSKTEHFTRAYYMLDDGSILGELFQDIRGGSGRESKDSDPTIMVVIFTAELITV